jgi:hypothetical protein
VRGGEVSAKVSSMQFLLCLSRGELRGETHPARADLTSAPGGSTLGREQGELDADFTYLGENETSSLVRSN